MSCYEWERGEIKIPPSAWSNIKAAVRSAFNASQDRAMALALAMRTQLLKDAAGKRNVDWMTLYRTESRQKLAAADLDLHEHEALAAVLPYQRRSIIGSAGAPLTPKRKNFAYATSTTKKFDLGEARITFEEENRTLVWSVSENNHACERARNHPVAQAMFRILEKITWTSQSGGCIIGNDEYNRDNQSAGGGGNYIKITYGPAKKASTTPTTSGLSMQMRF